MKAVLPVFMQMNKSHNNALQAILQTRPLFAVRAKAQKIGQARKTPELGVIAYKLMNKALLAKLVLFNGFVIGCASAIKKR